MLAAISLFVILLISLLVVRIASVALVHTGLGREAARFQARSAFTGAGYTTSEAESVVVVHLFPRVSSSYERLELRAHRATGEIAGTTVVDLFGNETTIDFAQIRENIDPPADVFRPHLPEGVELIDLGAAP